MTVKYSVPDYLFTFIFKLIVIEKKHLLVRLNICSSFNGWHIRNISRTRFATDNQQYDIISYLIRSSRTCWT